LEIESDKGEYHNLSMEETEHENPKMVEVVVGILNKDCGSQLRGCLESLLGQSFREMVVVVVDGGSTDNSIEVIKEFMKFDERVRYFVQKGKGTGAARNELIDYVRENFPEAKVIVWGDAENTYKRDYLSSLLRVDGDIVGGINIIDSDSPLSQALWWYYNGVRGEAFVGNNEAVKVHLYEKYRYLPITRTEDFFFQREISKGGVKAQKTRDAVCYIKTVESLSDFVKWERARAKGLWEGSTMTGTTHFLWATYILALSIYVGYLVLAPIILALLDPSLLVPYSLTLLLFSAYMWLKGRTYVKKMRLRTILLFIPFLLMDSIAILSTLLKLRFGSQSKEEKIP